MIDNRLNDLLTLVDANSPNIATRIDEIKEELDVFIKIYSLSGNSGVFLFRYSSDRRNSLLLKAFISVNREM